MQQVGLSDFLLFPLLFLAQLYASVKGLRTTLRQRVRGPHRFTLPQISLGCLPSPDVKFPFQIRFSV